MENNNEEVVVNDVPETSNEEVLDEVVVNASQDETNQETNTEDDINERIEARANELMEEKIKDRIARDRASQERKFNKELAKYKQLENVINAGLGVDNLDDAISKTSSYYREQGIEIPEYRDTYNDRQQERLAKLDAQDIIELGKEEMEAEANKIASIPLDKRTPYEKSMFDELCKKLMSLKDVDDLKAKGYKTDILETKEFIDFRNQFNVNTPIYQIYEMYNKINGQVVKQPASPGSAKTNATNNEIKEYYTPEEVRKFTEEDFDNNPKLYEAVEKSMLQWNKSN
jgi:hypothetical protein